MKQTTKYLLLALLTTVLIACESDNSKPDTIITVMPTDTGSSGTGSSDAGSTVTPAVTTDTGSTVTLPETTDLEPVTGVTGVTGGGEDTTVNPTSDQVQIGVFGPPQFLQSECGSVAVSNVEATNTAAAPMSVNQPVQGQLIEGSSVLGYHLWEITLQPGNYHLVADYWNADSEFGAVGLEINSLVDGDEERLGRDSVAGYDGRLYSFFVVENPTTLSLQVDPAHDDAMNYVMGIIANGAAVPSPRFTNCPPVTRIGLNEAQSLVLPDVNSSDDFQWFQMSLSPGVYFLDATMSSVERDAMGYEFELLEKFGEDDTLSRISRDSGFTDLLMSSDQFSVLENSDIWIRASSVHDNKAVDFTVYQ